ncbi:MAG: DUF6600 domain-containing protein [Terriglobia bacterium]
MQLRTFLLAGLLTAATAFGQDPPSRVARLNWISGDVSFQPAGIETWTTASVNYPLTTGDHLYTDQASRAELHIGPNAFRLNEFSNFGFLNLDDNTVQVRFTGGSLEIRLRRLDDQDLYEVDTPQVAVSLLRTGDYRIDTDPDRNATMVTVNAGQVEVSANGISFTVRARQTAYFADGLQPDIRDANPPDDFDRFAADRNAREDRLPPPVHVSSSMAGYEDLDAYGSWRDDSDYGWVWAPRVNAGWVPYREGRWAWVDPWGWTWVDQEPWGFAPFHYGRWANFGGVWAWAPGAIVARPVYAPALVVFVGGSYLNGGVAWFPLGPRERYVPSYRTSDTYLRQVNINHITNINVTNVYVNRRVPGAVTAVSPAAFTGSRAVGREAVAVSPAQVAQGPILGTAPPLSPTRQSMMATGRVNARVAEPPPALNRAVVAREVPPPPPVSFQARQQAIEQNQGRPLAPDQVAQIRRQQPGAVVNRPLVRGFSTPSPVPALPNRPAPQSPGPPANRMDSRPPIAPQFGRQPVPNPAPEAVPVSPQFGRRPRDAGAAPPQPAPRPSPEAVPVAPQFGRQPREDRPPAPRPEPQAAPRVVPESRPAPERQEAAPQPRAVPEGRSIQAPAVAPPPRSEARPERAPAPAAEKKAEKAAEKP